jgi:hypothetical protein
VLMKFRPQSKKCLASTLVLGDLGGLGDFKSPTPIL